MTAPTAAATGTARTPRPGRLPPRWLVVTAVLVLGIALTDTVSQAVVPFIRRDDWPFLLPPHTPFTSSVYAKNLSEGRWLNWAWWAAIGQHSTPLTASLTYVTAYVVFVGGLWRVLRPVDRTLAWAVDALLGLAVFASALWVQLLYWPGTLTPSVLVAAVAVWTLPWAAHSRPRLGVWLLLATVLTTLTYPPVGVVLFLTAVVQMRARPWKDVLLLAAGYVVAYAVGVAVIYGLNGIFFGHLGLEIAGWRHPNPPHDLHALRVNAGRFAREVLRLGSALWVAALVGIVAVVAGWLDRTVRPLLLRLVLGLVVVVGLSAVQTLVTGVVTDPRGELWAWMAVLVPAALLLGGARSSPRIGVACLAALTVFGVLTWRADIGAHQRTRSEYAALVDRATQAGPSGSRRPVVLYQDPGQRATTKGSIMAGTLRMMVRQAQGGVVPRWCAAAECARIKAAGTSVVDLRSVVGLVVPPPPAWI